MANNNFDTVVFGKKTFSDLLKDIYNNNKKIEDQIEDLINTLKPFIKTTNEVIAIVPIIKEYMDVQVKSNEHLVKMASIVQRAIANSGNNSEDIFFTEAEKEQLLLEINSLGEQQKQISETIKNEN